MIVVFGSSFLSPCLAVVMAAQTMEGETEKKRQREGEREREREGAEEEGIHNNEEELKDIINNK